ncbi:hypothetical protein ABK040_008704 [Willaertia magna]
MASIDVVGCEVGISTANHIRIAIFPVGKINAITFKTFVEMIQNLNAKPIKSLTRFRDDNLKSPFQKQDWQRSILQFYFVDDSDIITNYSDFLQYRNIHGVIGIMSCLAEESVASGFTKYKKTKLSVYGKNVVGRCFAVEQDPEMMAPEDEELVVIPNQDESHVTFHIDYLFSDIVRQVLIRFEKIAANPLVYFNELSNSYFMSSSNSSSNLTGSSTSGGSTMIKNAPIGTSAIKKKGNTKQETSTSPVNPKDEEARNMLQNYKLFADLSLLISDFEDAWNTYLEINTLSKQLTNNASNHNLAMIYSFFQGGSAEGLASVLLTRNKAFKNIIDSTLLLQIGEYLQEAIICYEKSKKRDLLVELYIKTAVFYANYGDKKKRKEALDCLTKAVQIAVTLTTQERIIVSGFASKICRQMKCKRKFGFFLRHVALLHHELCNQGVSIRLGSQCLDSYNIPIDLTPRTEWKPTKLIQNQRGWRSIQLEILKNMIDFSQSMSPADYSTEIQFRFYLLTEYHNVLSKADQDSHLKRVLSISHQIPRDVNILLKPLPILKSIIPLKMAAHLEPKAIEKKEVKSSLFIYSPFDKKDETLVQLNWVKDEVTQVFIEFYNPFKVDLRLRNVTVKFTPEVSPIDNNEIINDVFVHSCVVFSGNTSKLIITTKPKVTGKIILEAIGIEFENGRFKSPIYLPVTPQHFLTEKKEKRQYDITVIENVPLLNVTLSTPQLTLVDGETTTLLAKLNNTGNCPITFIEFSFKNQTSNEVFIKEDITKSLPLESEVVTIPIEVIGHWKGSSDVGTIIIHIKYGFDSQDDGKTYYRELELSIKTSVIRGIVVEECMTVNESFNKKIVAKIHNYSNSSFILLSSNSQYLKDEQFDTGIPFGAQSTKMILIDPSILHNINFEDLNIPYTADINNYRSTISGSMRWKSYVNTFGIVGCKEDIEQKATSGAARAARRQTTVNSLPAKMNEFIIVKQKVHATVGSENSSIEYSHHELVKQQKDIIVDIAQQIDVKVLISIQSTNKDQQEGEFNKIASLSFTVYQDAENGSRIISTQNQFCYSGKLNTCIELLPSVTSENFLRLFFLEKGMYILSVVCSDEETQEMLASPSEITVIVK